MERFGESESPEDAPITSALSLIPTHFASREEVMAFLENPLFREPPEEELKVRKDATIQTDLAKRTEPIIFDNTDFFYCKPTGMSWICYGETLDHPGKFCVVKFINPQLLYEGDFDDAKKRIGRFRREIEFLIRHQENPLWIRVQKTGERPHPFFQVPLEPCPYLVLDFCPGIDGDNFCTAPAFREVSANPAFLAAFALASLRIFADAMEEGRILRDFKTGNVMITPTGFVFIDPGSISEIDSDLTPRGFVNGTPEFMSPEQASGGALDFRSDLYSLGICLFYFATKRYPFTGKNGRQTMLKHLKMPVPMEKLNHLPLGLRSLIFMLLKKDPQDRFQSFEEAADCFRPFVQGTEMESLLPPMLVHKPSFMPVALGE